MKGINGFVGKWVSTLPFDSADFLIEYVISLEDDSVQIEARDLQDGEKMEISDISFNRETLSFTSYMPSTARRGINQFRLKDENLIETEFTFTVVEELKRHIGHRPDDSADS